MCWCRSMRRCSARQVSAMRRTFARSSAKIAEDCKKLPETAKATQHEKSRCDFIDNSASQSQAPGEGKHVLKGDRPEALAANGRICSMLPGAAHGLGSKVESRRPSTQTTDWSSA